MYKIFGPEHVSQSMLSFCLQFKCLFLGVEEICFRTCFYTTPVSNQSNECMDSISIINVIIKQSIY